MFRLKLAQQFNKLKSRLRKPEKKEEYLEKWSKELDLGRHLEYVTRTDGYQQARAHFEEIVNIRLRSKENPVDNINFVEGVETVFRFFERGKEMANKAEDQIEKFKDQ